MSSLSTYNQSVGSYLEVGSTNPLPVVDPNGVDTSTSGSITTQNLVPAGVATASSSVAMLPATKDTLSVQVTGTYTGALSVQGTVDGSNWVTIGGVPITNVSTGAQVAAIPSAAVGIWQIGVGGFSQIRVTALAAVTGTAVVTMWVTSGNSYVALDTPLPAGANSIGTVISQPVTSAQSPYLLVTAASTNANFIKSTSGCLYELTVSNVTATAIFVKLYNKASAPTVGTDVPIVTLSVPANTTLPVEFGALGKRFSTGIAIAATAAAPATDTAVAVAGVQISGTFL